jgi:DNA-binding NarL/FixJ family response regulator
MTENYLLSAREHAAQARIKALEIFTQSLLNKNRRLSTGITEVIPADRRMAAKPPEIESRVEEEMPMQMKILTEDDWQTYLHYFEQAYHGFINQVQERFPNLTPAELRLFLLLKQGYDTKEIAELLGISIAGAKKNRYRLRKKIGLEEMDNLDQFVREFK